MEVEQMLVSKWNSRGLAYFTLSDYRKDYSERGASPISLSGLIWAFGVVVATRWQCQHLKKLIDKQTEKIENALNAILASCDSGQRP